MKNTYVNFGTGMESVKEIRTATKRIINTGFDDSEPVKATIVSRRDIEECIRENRPLELDRYSPEEFLQSLIVE